MAEPNIHITGGETHIGGDMIGGDVHHHYPPEPPREFMPPFQMLPDLQTFVGRDKQIQTLAGLGVVGAGNPRFLIAGDGGMGKTKLAARVTRLIQSAFPGGILLAEIPNADPFLVLDNWARAYDGDVREFQDLATRADRVRDLIRQRVGNKRVLAVLDGVVDESDDAKLGPLLRALSHCAVLVTSRACQLASIPDAFLIDLAHLNADETFELFQRVTQYDARVEHKRDAILARRTPPPRHAAMGRRQDTRHSRLDSCELQAARAG